LGLTVLGLTALAKIDPAPIAILIAGNDSRLAAMTVSDDDPPAEQWIPGYADLAAVGSRVMEPIAAWIGAGL
jgi:hypothetical protein